MQSSSKSLAVGVFGLVLVVFFECFSGWVMVQQQNILNACNYNYFADLCDVSHYGD